MNNFRENGIVGVLEFEDNIVPVTLHFSEWWNGEGIDYNFINERGKFVSLHMDEIESLVVAAKLTGLISFKTIKKKVKKVRKETETRNQELQNFKDQFYKNNEEQIGD